MIKVLILGLDGLGYHQACKFLAGKTMPFVKNTISSCNILKLQPVLPINSAANWASFATGLDPAKHGLYDFIIRSKPDYKPTMIDSSYVKAPLFWEILSEIGIKSIIINVPFTFPAKPLNGLLIAGMLTPIFPLASPSQSVTGNFCYPQDLSEVIKKVAPGYKFELDSFKKFYDRSLSFAAYEELINEAIDLSNARARIASYLMRHYQWDFCFAVFTEIDRIMHFSWGFLDPKHPLFFHEKASFIRRLVIHFFEKLDKHLQLIIENLNEPFLLLLLSDHGFRSYHTRFHIANWLREQGLFFIDYEFAEGINSSIYRGPSDLEKTLAIPSIASTSGLYISNIQGAIKFSGSLRKFKQHLKHNLEKLNFIKTVYFKEDILKGPFSMDAPDLLIETNEGFSLTSRINKESRLLSDSKPITGTHGKNAFLVVVPKGLSIAPTIKKDWIITDIIDFVFSILNVKEKCKLIRN